MTIKIAASDLASALSRAKSVVESRSTIPVLAMAKIEAADGKLTVTTTNLNIEYKQVIDAVSSEPMSFCVDANRLANMASAASGTITMEPKSKNIFLIKSGKSRWSAPTLPVDDFPTMSVTDLCEPLVFNDDTLSEIIRRTKWAASDEAARHYLGGVFLNNDNDHARYVATNGRECLTSVETKQKWPDSAPDVILPSKLLDVIRESAGAGGSIAWDDKKLQFVTGDITITGKTIDGTFPDYRRVIPENCEPYAASVNDLLGAIKRVRLASDAKERRLRIKINDGALHLRIDGTSGFEGEEEVDADSADGFEYCVNADYFASMLAAIDDEKVIIEHEQNTMPIRITPGSQKPDDSFIGVVMPMRL